MSFRDAFGRTYGDAFGCCPQLPQQYQGYAVQSYPLQPQSRALRGMYGQPYGTSAEDWAEMGLGPTGGVPVPTGGGAGGGGKVNWNQVASGAGSFLSNLFSKNQPAPAQQPYVAPGYPAQQYQYPPPPAATASWVLPAALIGGVGVVGTIVYLLTK